MRLTPKASQLAGIILLNEGGVRVCSDVVVLDFWCRFAEIFILICRTVVLQNQVVCDV